MGPAILCKGLVIDQKLQQNKYTAKMASTARRQIIGGGAPINTLSAAARPAHGSM